MILRKNIFTLLIILISLACSCNGDYKIEKHTLGNGVKVIAKSHIDSAHIEHVKVYHANGELEKIFTQIYSAKHGLEKVFYKSSNSQYDYNYLDGELNGIQKEYFDSKEKKTKSLSYYELGKLIGNQLEFYKNGKIKRHIIVSPKYEICNEVSYDINGEQLNLNSNRFSFGELDKETYKVGDIIKLRTFIFSPKNYEIKYFSSFHSEKKSKKFNNQKIINNMISQNFNLSKSENYVLEERLEIRDLINDTLFIDKHSVIISPNSKFH